MRNATITRKTAETDIVLSLSIREDGRKGSFSGTSGIGFFDHMLTSFAAHGSFDITLTVTGDWNVDCHHTVEDIGIVLGTAFRTCIGDGCGMARFADILLPMDEALCRCAVDVGGRAYLVFDADFKADRIGAYDTQMTAEFMRALAFNAGLTLHMSILYGENDHHKTEACYKALAKCLKDAVKLVSGEIPSSKGVL